MPRFLLASIPSRACWSSSCRLRRSRLSVKVYYQDSTSYKPKERLVRIRHQTELRYSLHECTISFRWLTARQQLENFQLFGGTSGVSYPTNSLHEKQDKHKKRAVCEGLCRPRKNVWPIHFHSSQISNFYLTFTITTRDIFIDESIATCELRALTSGPVDAPPSRLSATL